MTTRTPEDKKFRNIEEPIGHNLANNFLQNRSLMASTENKEMDMWAGGGEHLSTSKLSSMLNSMQGRLKDLPAVETHEDERLWSLRSTSGDSLDMSEMDSVVFSNLPTEVSGSPLIFNYIDSASGSPGGPNRELRSIPRSGNYSRQDDDNDSLSSVSTTSSASALQRARRAKLNAKLAANSPNREKATKKVINRKQLDPESDYISDAASVTSVESHHGPVQRIRPPAEQSAKQAAPQIAQQAQAEREEVVITPQKPASPKHSPEPAPAVVVEPKRRYNPFTDALQSQIPGRGRSMSSQRARPTNAQSAEPSTPSTVSSASTASESAPPRSPDHLHGDIPRPRSRTPTGIPRAVTPSVLSPQGRQTTSEQAVERPKSAPHEPLVLFPLKDLMSDRLNRSPRSVESPSPVTPVTENAKPEHVSEEITVETTSPAAAPVRSFAPTPVAASIEVKTSPPKEARPARMTASSLAQNPVVAQLLNPQDDRGRPRARTPTGTFGRSSRLSLGSVPSVSAADAAESASVEARGRGRSRERSTTPTNVPQRGRSGSRGASSARPTTPTATKTAAPVAAAGPAPAASAKWQQPHKGRTTAPSQEPLKTRSSFGSTVSRPVVPLTRTSAPTPAIKSPPGRNLPSSSRASLLPSTTRAKSPVTAPQRSKSPVTAPTRSKSPVTAPARSKSPTATTRARSPSATGRTSKSGTPAAAATAGPSWSSTMRTPTKINTNVVQVSLPGSRTSHNGSSASSISSTNSRNSTPTNASGSSSRLGQSASSAGRGVGSQFASSSVQTKSTNPHPLRKPNSPRSSPGSAVVPTFPPSPPVVPAAAKAATPKNRRASDGGTPVTAARPATASKIAGPSPKPDSASKPRSSYPGGMTRSTPPTTPSNVVGANTAGDSEENNNYSVAKLTAKGMWQPPAEATLFVAGNAAQCFMLPMAHLAQEAISGVYDSAHYNPSPAFFMRSPRAASKYTQRVAEAQRDRERSAQQAQWRSESADKEDREDREDREDQGSGRTETTQATGNSGSTTDFLPTEGLFAIDEAGSLSDALDQEQDLEQEQGSPLSLEM